MNGIGGAHDLDGFTSIWLPLIVIGGIVAFLIGARIVQAIRDYRRALLERDELGKQVHDLSAGQADLKLELLTIDESLRQAGGRYAELAGEFHQLRKDLETRAQNFASERNHWQRRLIELENERDEQIAERARVEESYRKAIARHQQAEESLRAGLAPVKSFEATAAEFYGDDEKGIC